MSGAVAVAETTTALELSPGILTSFDPLPPALLLVENKSKLMAGGGCLAREKSCCRSRPIARKMTILFTMLNPWMDPMIPDARALFLILLLDGGIVHETPI